MPLFVHVLALVVHSRSLCAQASGVKADIGVDGQIHVLDEEASQLQGSKRLIVEDVRVHQPQDDSRSGWIDVPQQKAIVEEIHGFLKKIGLSEDEVARFSYWISPLVMAAADVAPDDFADIVSRVAVEIQNFLDLPENILASHVENLREIVATFEMPHEREENAVTEAVQGLPESQSKKMLHALRTLIDDDDANAAWAEVKSDIEEMLEEMPEGIGDSMAQLWEWLSNIVDAVHHRDQYRGNDVRGIVATRSHIIADNLQIRQPDSAQGNAYGVELRHNATMDGSPEVEGFEVQMLDSDH